MRPKKLVYMAVAIIPSSAAARTGAVGSARQQARAREHLSAEAVADAVDGRVEPGLPCRARGEQVRLAHGREIAGADAEQSQCDIPAAGEPCPQQALRA